VEGWIVKLEIRIEEPGDARLVRDYRAGAGELAPYFTGSPWDPAAYRRKAEEISGRVDGAARAVAAAAVRPLTAAAAARLERIAGGEGFFVTTGQQAGLFTGPLLTIYKALSAVRLARALEAELGVPVAPLFWVASDDHDWEEVRRAVVLDAGNAVRRIELETTPDAPPASMARRRPGSALAAALQALEAALPPTEFRPALLEAVRRHYAPGATMAAAFAGLLGDLLAPFDLLLVDPAAPVLKRLAAPVLALELARTAEHEALLAEQTRRLVTAGYHAQVPLQPGATNLFVEDEEGRERLVREDGRFLLRRTKRSLAAPEVAAWLEAEPEAFSPNVLLRPVVESALFPTLAYVAGPGELSYYAQIGCLFRAHGIEMPLVFPRHGATLVEAKVRKVLQKFDMDVPELSASEDRLAARVVRDELPPEVSRALAGLRLGLEEGYAELGAAAAAIDPTLQRPLEGARNTSLAQLDGAEKKVLSHLKKQNEVSLEQLAKARDNLYPGGTPQERVLNVLQYVVRYGPELLPAVAEAMEIRLDAAASTWSGVRCGAY
jgi:bacillithiol synthase